MNEDQVRQLAEVEQRARSNTRRIDRLEERLDKLETVSVSVAAMQVELKNVLQTVTDIKTAVDGLQKRPGTWWDKLLLAVLTALVAYAVARFTGGAA